MAELPPGRPSLVTYADVEAAANRLVASGGRPTSRAVRELLGGGSLATIQRHLRDWSASRHRTRASRPFDVSPEDVERLTALDLVALINYLLRLETRENGITADTRSTHRIEVADGGIDGIVTWQGGPRFTPHLPARIVAWQAKSGHRLRPAELVREIQQRDGQDLKEGVRDVFAQNGAYVLFSAADMTAEQQTQAISAMRDAVRSHLPACDANVTVFAAEEIASWAARDLWARTFLMRAAGREFPATLLTFDEWQRQPALQNPYTWTDSTRTISTELRAAVRVPGTVYRLTGAAGLGKTRLALESLRDLDCEYFGAVYFDARHAGIEADLLRALPQWKRFGVRGVIVVDDCSLSLHNRLAQELHGSSLSAVTIDTRHDSGSNASLWPLDNSIVESIVRSCVTQSNTLAFRISEMDIYRVVDYAQGWPRMAIMVLDALQRRAEHVANLRDDELTQRLVNSNVDPDAERALRVLALFDHVGHAHDVESEWETVRQMLIPDLTRDKFHRIVRSYEAAGLIVSIGRYWRVTPPPLAIRLTHEWLNEALPEIKRRLFDDLPEALSESLARRFRDVSTPTAVRLAKELFSPDGRFGSLAGILGKANSEMVYALAQTDPESAVEALKRSIMPLDDNALRAIDDNVGRQTLVFALECIAFHAGQFKDAARILFALARTENASNSNNATGTLVKLFNVSGSQTEAPPPDRLAVLDEMFMHKEPSSSAIVAESLRAILSHHLGYVRLGPESQGGRPPLVEWRPSTWDELFDYYHGASERVVRLSTAGPNELALAREVASDGMLTLVRHRRWDDLAMVIGELKGGAWPKAVEQLTWLLQHELKDADSDSVGRIQRFLLDLTPRDISDRINLYVTNPPRNMVERDGDIIDGSLEHLQEFARETMESGSFKYVISVLSTGDHQLPHAYGTYLAELTTDLAALAGTALDAYANAAEPRNEMVLMGITRVAARRDPNLRQVLLERVVADDRLINALPMLSGQPRFDSADIRRLSDVYANRRIESQPPGWTFIGKTLSEANESDIRALATIFCDLKWWPSVVQMLTFGVTPEQAKRYDDIVIRVVLESDFISSPLPDVHEWSLLQTIHRILGNRNDEFAMSLTARLMEFTASRKADFHSKRRLAELWPALLRHDSVWHYILESFAALNKRQRLELLSAMQYNKPGEITHRLALEERGLEDVMDFAHQYVDDVPWFLARFGEIIIERRDAALSVSALMEALLQRFGDRDDVLRNLDATFHSFLSVGPRAGYYEERIALLDNIPTFGNAKVAAWKESLRTSLLSERQRAKNEDDEFQGGIW